MIKKTFLLLTFVLLTLFMFGCSKDSSTDLANELNNNDLEDNNIEQQIVIDNNAQEIESELNDPSLSELDNINLDDW